MLFDSVYLTDGAQIFNSHVESGTAFPTTDVTVGRMFYLTQAVGNNQVGLYVYNGTTWITGDVTSVIAGIGLTGGGSSGDVTINVDETIIATQVWVGQNYQPLNTDLNAIVAVGANGFLKKVSTGNWTLDTNTYLTGNQNISVTGDATGSGATSIALTLANSGVTAGTYKSVTVDAKGRVTGGTNPTTLAGYGITDAQLASYQYTLTIGDGTTTQVSYLTNQTLNLVAGTNIVLAFDDVNNKVTFSTASNMVGNVATASQLQTPRSISITGDATWTTTFDGSGNVTGALTLANSGVTAGTYTKVTVDAKGRVTVGAAVASADVTTALGYTPLNPNQLNVANGIATLDSSGKLLTSQIPAALVGAVVFQGTWNASTNTPTLTSGTGTKGNYYVVSVTGTTTIDGISQWSPGDAIIFNGTTWNKIDGTANEVLSVAGRTGNVVLTTSDVSEGTNLYYTNARASAAAPVQTVFGRSGAVVLQSSDVTTALGYTPVNKGGDTVTGTMTYSGQNTFTGGPNISTSASGATLGVNNGGTLLLINGSGGTDGKKWDFLTGANTLSFRTIDDAWTTGVPWLTATRSGNAVTAISTSVRPTFNGNLAWDAGNFTPGNYAALGSANTFTSGVTISYASPNLSLIASAAGQQARINFSTNGSQRWGILKNLDSESGSNAGSSLAFNRYDDTGALIDSAVSISRATGVMTLVARPIFAGNAPWDAGNFNPSTAFALGVTTNVQLNSAAKASTITLSNGNLTATFASGQGVVLGNTGSVTTAGNLYFEVKFVSGTSSGNAAVGLVPANEATNVQIGYNDAGSSVGCFQSSGNIYINGGTASGSAASFSAAGSVVCVAFNPTSRLVWFRVNNGNWNGNASNNPSTGVGGITFAGTGSVFPAICSDSASVWTINMLNSFAYSVPSGFNGWYVAAPSTGQSSPTDVAISQPASNQVLMYNGTAWVNSNPTISFTGDATGSGSTSIALTLANSGVTAGTYSAITVNAKGIVTSGGAIGSSVVTTALGYTPVNPASAAITGGTINGTSVGATTASTGAFTTLSSSGLATLNSISTASATITGGTINGTAIGGTTASSGAFTTITSTTSGSTQSIAITDVGANGANIRLNGNGATTPNKSIRANSGTFQVVNHAYTSVIFQVDDSGNTTVYGTLTASSGINGTPIGATTASTGAFTTLSTSGTATLNGMSTGGATISGGTINGTSVGATTASTGAFTTLSATTGALITGMDANGAQVRITSGNYGTLLRNDGSNMYFLQTASGSQSGSWNTYRPFAWNLATGAVTIDGTGLGTTFGGAVTGTFFNGSVNAAVAAAGTTQGTATALTTSIAVVTSGTGGVVLPTAVAGMMVTVINTTGATINVYPAVGAQIDTQGSNVAFTLGTTAKLEFVAISATQWYSLTAVYA